MDPVRCSVHDFIAPQKGVAATGDASEAAALLHRGIVLPVIERREGGGIKTRGVGAHTRANGTKLASERGRRKVDDDDTWSI